MSVNVVSGAVQVGYIDHEVVINPSRKDLHHSELNLIVSATEQKKVGEFVRSHFTGVAGDRPAEYQVMPQYLWYCDQVTSRRRLSEDS